MIRIRIPAKPSKVTRGENKLSTHAKIDIRIKALNAIDQVENKHDTKLICQRLGYDIDNLSDAQKFDVMKRLHYSKEPYEIDATMPKKVWDASVKLKLNKIHGVKMIEPV